MCVRIRAASVLVLCTAGLAVVGRVVAGGLATGDPGSAAVVTMCSLALLAALGWAWLTVLAGVVDAWRWAGGGVETPRSAHGLRRWVLAASGVALTGALSGALAGPAAQATPGLPPAPATAPVSAQATVLVSAPLAEPSVPSAVTTARRPAAMTVRPGDCLWSIAAAEVQPGAGPATVAARWRAIYRANRDVVGADPDLIRPGQRLRLPR